MAWSNSKVFAYAVSDVLQGNTNWKTDTIKVALYANSSTPDNTVSTAVATEYAGAASQWLTYVQNSNSLGYEPPTGSGYTAGGVAVTTPLVAQNYASQGQNVTAYYSAGSPQWTSATISAYGCLVYDTTQSNKGLSYNYFGGQQQVTLGTFTIAWNTNGIATFTC